MVRFKFRLFLYYSVSFLLNYSVVFYIYLLICEDPSKPCPLFP